MANRYQQMFDRLGKRGEIALGTFLMLGHPNREASARLLDTLVASGADMVEVGIPFSDPVADGPVIQAAADRALASGMRVDDSMVLIAALRARHPDVPIGILTYANILVARGVERFCADLADAGADSLLVADVPAIEAEPFAAQARACGLDWVMIAAGNSSRQTIETIGRIGTGYSYCVTRYGVTGASAGLDLGDRRLFDDLNAAGAPPPVLGFGISGPDQVRAAARSGASGAIVGSALVTIAGEPDPEPRLAELVAALKAATRIDAAD